MRKDSPKKQLSEKDSLLPNNNSKKTSWNKWTGDLKNTVTSAAFNIQKNWNTKALENAVTTNKQNIEKINTLMKKMQAASEQADQLRSITKIIATYPTKKIKNSMLSLTINYFKNSLTKADSTLENKIAAAKSSEKRLLDRKIILSTLNLDQGKLSDKVNSVKAINKETNTLLKQQTAVYNEICNTTTKYQELIQAIKQMAIKFQTLYQQTENSFNLVKQLKENIKDAKQKESIDDDENLLSHGKVTTEETSIAIKIAKINKIDSENNKEHKSQLANLIELLSQQNQKLNPTTVTSLVNKKITPFLNKLQLINHRFCITISYQRVHAFRFESKKLTKKLINEIKEFFKSQPALLNGFLNSIKENSTKESKEKFQRFLDSFISKSLNIIASAAYDEQDSKTSVFIDNSFNFSESRYVWEVDNYFEKNDKIIQVNLPLKNITSKKFNDYKIPESQIKFYEQIITYIFHYQLIYSIATFSRAAYQKFVAYSEDEKKSRFAQLTVQVIIKSIKELNEHLTQIDVLQQQLTNQLKNMNGIQFQDNIKNKELTLPNASAYDKLFKEKDRGLIDFILKEIQIVQTNEATTFNKFKEGLLEFRKKQLNTLKKESKKLTKALTQQLKELKIDQQQLTVVNNTNENKQSGKLKFKATSDIDKKINQYDHDINHYIQSIQLLEQELKLLPLKKQLTTLKEAADRLTKKLGEYCPPKPNALTKQKSESQLDFVKQQIQQQQKYNNQLEDMLTRFNSKVEQLNNVKQETKKLLAEFQQQINTLELHEEKPKSFEAFQETDKTEQSNDLKTNEKLPEFNKVIKQYTLQINKYAHYNNYLQRELKELPLKRSKKILEKLKDEISKLPEQAQLEKDLGENCPSKPKNLIKNVSESMLDFVNRQIEQQQKYLQSLQNAYNNKMNKFHDEVNKLNKAIETLEQKLHNKNIELPTLRLTKTKLTNSTGIDFIEPEQSVAANEMPIQELQKYIITTQSEIKNLTDYKSNLENKYDEYIKNELKQFKQTLRNLKNEIAVLKIKLLNLPIQRTQNLAQVAASQPLDHEQQIKQLREAIKEERIYLNSLLERRLGNTKKHVKLLKLLLKKKPTHEIPKLTTINVISQKNVNSKSELEIQADNLRHKIKQQQSNIKVLQQKCRTVLPELEVKLSEVIQEKQNINLNVNNLKKYLGKPANTTDDHPEIGFPVYREVDSPLFIEKQIRQYKKQITKSKTKIEPLKNEKITLEEEIKKGRQQKATELKNLKQTATRLKETLKNNGFNKLPSIKNIKVIKPNKFNSKFDKELYNKYGYEIDRYTKYISNLKSFTESEEEKLNKKLETLKVKATDLKEKLDKENLPKEPQKLAKDASETEMAFIQRQIKQQEQYISKLKQAQDAQDKKYLESYCMSYNYALKVEEIVKKDYNTARNRNKYNANSFWKKLAPRKRSRNDMVDFILQFAKLILDKKTKLLLAENQQQSPEEAELYKATLLYAACLVVNKAIQKEGPLFTSILKKITAELTTAKNQVNKVKKENTTINLDKFLKDLDKKDAVTKLSDFWNNAKNKPQLKKWKKWNVGKAIKATEENLSKPVVNN